MDTRVVTELQHIEVAPLHAAPDAVDPGDVGAFALHGKQGSHHLFVAVMLELRGAHQGPRQTQQEGSGELGESPPPLHGCAAREARRRGGEERRLERRAPGRNTHYSLDCVSVSSHAKHTAPASFLAPFFPLLSLCLLPRTDLTLKSKQGQPPMLLLCLTLLLQQLPLTPSLSSPCQVHATCFIGAQNAYASSSSPLGPPQQSEFFIPSL